MTSYSRGPSHTRADIALRGVYEISKVLAVPAGRLENTLGNVLTLLSSFLDMHHGLVALLDDKGNPRSVVGIGAAENLIVAAEMFLNHPHRVFPVTEGAAFAGMIHRSDVLAVLSRTG